MKPVLRAAASVAAVLAIALTGCASPFPMSIGDLQEQDAAVEAPTAGLCETGSLQSPIALDTAAAVPATDEPRLSIPEADIAGFSVTAGGSGSIVVSSGRPYLAHGESTLALTEIELRAPAEHVIDGIRHPAELQFVFGGDEGTLILALAAAEGEASAALDDLIDAARGTLRRLSLPLADMLPAAPGALAYDGSRTTAPCTEDVTWLVLTEPVDLSTAQLDALAAGFARAPRDLQPADGREVRTATPTLD